MDFGTKLKQLRKDKKITQEELAREFGLTASAISRYEKNIAYPKQKVLEQYSSFFDVDLKALLILKEKNKKQKAIQNIQSIRNIQKSDYKENSLDKNYDQTIIFSDTYIFCQLPFIDQIDISSTENNNQIQTEKTIDVFLEKGIYSSIENLIAVRVNSESMDKIIVDNAIVIIDKKANIKSGDIIIYRLNEKDYEIKRIYDYSNYIKLCPESHNSIFHEQNVIKEQSEKVLHVLGKVIDVKFDRRLLN